MRRSSLLRAALIGAAVSLGSLGSLPACSRDALLTVGVPGTGASTVLFLPDGAVALERDAPGIALPALGEDTVVRQPVLALDYSRRLADLYLPRGALVDDPAGKTLPEPSEVFRLRLTPDGEGFEWLPAETNASDRARRFAGIGGRTIACPSISTRPAATGTVTLSGEPRFLVNVGPGRVWVGLTDQPARVLDVERGAWSTAELSGDGGVLLAASGPYGYNSVTTLRDRGGEVVFESWEIDLGTRRGQVARAPRYPGVPLPPADYRWLTSALLQSRTMSYALGADGVWVRFDDANGNRAPQVMARWTPGPFTGPVRGGVVVAGNQDAVAVLSDSNVVRWLNRGSDDVQQVALGTAPLTGVRQLAGTDDVLVTAADGRLFRSRNGITDWEEQGQVPSGEGLTTSLTYDDDRVQILGERGLISTWRLGAGGFCADAMATLPGAPVMFTATLIEPPARALALAHHADGRVAVIEVLIGL